MGKVKKVRKDVLKAQEYVVKHLVNRRTQKIARRGQAKIDADRRIPRTSAVIGGKFIVPEPYANEEARFK